VSEVKGAVHGGVLTFPNGAILFDYCNKFGFEGVVSKRVDKPYVSGPTRYLVKTKCPDWVRDNTHRHKLFEGPKKPLAPSEREKALQKKREELARVQERLARPALRPGMRTPCRRT
jgi:hypothetical protein